jgi:hypothetical protein
MTVSTTSEAGVSTPAGRHRCGSFDLLKIDSEGLDDEVISLLSIDVMKTVLTNFEAVSPENERLNRLLSYMSAHGHTPVSLPVDALAARSTPRKEAN